MEELHEAAKVEEIKSKSSAANWMKSEAAVRAADLLAGAIAIDDGDARPIVGAVAGDGGEARSLAERITCVMYV